VKEENRYLEDRYLSINNLAPALKTLPKPAATRRLRRSSSPHPLAASW